MHALNTFVKFTRVSSNSKTGPIPVTMTEKESCPGVCPLKGSGCYAEGGPLNIHWLRVSSGEQCIDWHGLCDAIKGLPKRQLWRMNTAGDLPHIDEGINALLFDALIDANNGKHGFTYTHHQVEGETQTAQHNRAQISRANQSGFTVNLSANNPQHADKLAALNIAPVCTLIDIDAPKVSFTPNGLQITACPATYRADVNCSNCGICQVATRKSIIGFPVHGLQKKKARVIMLKTADNTGVN